MKTCFNTVTAGLHRPLEEILQACADVGFEGVELDLRHIDEALPRLSVPDLKATLDRFHLVPVSVMAFALAPFESGTDALDRARRGGEVANALGADRLLTYCSDGIPAGMTAANAREIAGERARRIADSVAPVKIALEPIGRAALMGGPVEALEIARLSERENVGIMLDTFHYYRSEISDEAILAIPLDKLLIVHVNDAEDRPITELRDSHRLHIGQGILPLAHTMQLLRHLGYDGYLSVELFREEYWDQPVSTVVRDAKLAMDQMIAAATGDRS